MVTASPRRDLEAVAGLPPPPSSIQAEQALLGGLMLDNGSWDRVADVVSGGDL